MAEQEGTIRSGMKRKSPPVSPSCPVSGALVKQEAGEGGAAVAHADLSTEVERPRVNVSLHVWMLHCWCCQPLKPPIFKCEAGHRMCGQCRGEGRCRRCGRDTTALVHCGPDVDEFVDAFRVPCPFEDYGCDSTVVYHDTAAHRAACAYAPLSCGVDGCPFAASLPMLRDHLTGAAHSWPLNMLPGYGKVLALRVPSEPARRLLVVEGDERRLFVLSVRAAGAGATIWAVSVSCVRTAAAAEAGPRFACIVWAQAPPPAGGKALRLMMEADVASCAVPGGNAVEEGMALYVPPPMLCGPAKEMHLRVRIDVVDPAPAARVGAAP